MSKYKIGDWVRAKISNDYINYHKDFDKIEGEEIIVKIIGNDKESYYSYVALIQSKIHKRTGQGWIINESDIDRFKIDAFYRGCLGFYFNESAIKALKEKCLICKS